MCGVQGEREREALLPHCQLPAEKERRSHVEGERERETMPRERDHASSSFFLPLSVVVVALGGGEERQSYTQEKQKEEIWEITMLYVSLCFFKIACKATML